MREIKFRAWDGRKMHYKYLCAGYEFCDCLSVGHKNLKAIMQYTGLKDKNGKEIHEGDIVQYGNNKHEVVEWNTRFVCKNEEFVNEVQIDCGVAEVSEYRLCTENEIEVIGNIYENPELLKGSK